MDRKFIDRPALEEPRLYIIMRSDLYQMNPGKGMAQAAHAANMFERDLREVGSENYVHGEYKEWEAGRGFGTTITLSAPLVEMQELAACMSGAGMMTGMVVDPSYPFSNHYGDFFTAEEITCMYVFVTTQLNERVFSVLRRFSLHP